MEKNENLLFELNVEIDNILEKETEKFLEDIFHKIIHDFLTYPKRQLTHGYDPPYDNSGMTVVILGDEFYNESDFETIGDFLEMYNGNSIATYVSGYGLMHQTFGEYYENELEGAMTQAIYSYLSDIDEKKLKLLVDEMPYYDFEEDMSEDELSDIVVEIADHYEFIYKAEEKCSETMNSVRQSSFKFWHKKLSASILAEINHKRELNEKQQAARRQEFNNLWSRLEKTYMFKYRTNMPQRVEMTNYNEFMIFLNENNVSKQERQLLVDYAPISLSNKVKCLLTSANSKH